LPLLHRIAGPTIELEPVGVTDLGSALCDPHQLANAPEPITQSAGRSGAGYVPDGSASRDGRLGQSDKVEHPERLLNICAGIGPGGCNRRERQV